MTVTSFDPRPRAAARLRHRIQGVHLPVAQWRWRAAYRRDLRRLAKAGDHLLRDIGLSPQQAAREAAKPFWRS